MTQSVSGLSFLWDLGLYPVIMAFPKKEWALLSVIGIRDSVGKTENCFRIRSESEQLEGLLLHLGINSDRSLAFCTLRTLLSFGTVDPKPRKVASSGLDSSINERDRVTPNENGGDTKCWVFSFDRFSASAFVRSILPNRCSLVFGTSGEAWGRFLREDFLKVVVSGRIFAVFPFPDDRSPRRTTAGENGIFFELFFWRFGPWLVINFWSFMLLAKRAEFRSDS